MKISLLFLVVFSFFFFSWALNVKPTSRTIDEKAFQVAIKSSFFKTTGIIDDLGAAYSLAGGESFSKNDYALFLKYKYIFYQVVLIYSHSQLFEGLNLE